MNKLSLHGKKLNNGKYIVVSIDSKNENFKANLKTYNKDETTGRYELITNYDIPLNKKTIDSNLSTIIETSLKIEKDFKTGWDKFSFFKVKFLGNKTLLILNNRHPFIIQYLSFLKDFDSNSNDKIKFQNMVDSILISFYESKLEIEQNSQDVIELLEQCWSFNLAKIFKDDI